MENPILYLAPMAGITDAAMREVCVLQGAQMTFTEMVSAKAMSFKDRKTADLLALSPAEERVGVQLFGRDPSILADMAQALEQTMGERLAEINLNMGCPAPKIVNNGEGCALMKDVALSSRMIAAVVKAARVPVTVKIRKGWDASSQNAPAFAKMAEDMGAAAVTIHGRTRDQFYAGEADWGMIRAVKDAVKIKVIGNGDIRTAQNAADMLKKTGCDAVMAARGALGNPFLFRQMGEALQFGEARTYPTRTQRLQMCLKQARLMVRNKGEKLAMLQMRAHAPHYAKGMPNAARLRERLVRVQTYAHLAELLSPFFDD